MFSSFSIRILKTVWFFFVYLILDLKWVILEFIVYVILWLILEFHCYNVFHVCAQFWGERRPSTSKLEQSETPLYAVACLYRRCTNRHCLYMLPLQAEALTCLYRRCWFLYRCCYFLRKRTNCLGRILRRTGTMIPLLGHEGSPGNVHIKARTTRDTTLLPKILRQLVYGLSYL